MIKYTGVDRGENMKKLKAAMWVALAFTIP